MVVHYSLGFVSHLLDPYFILIYSIVYWQTLGYWSRLRVILINFPICDKNNNHHTSIHELLTMLFFPAGLRNTRPLGPLPSRGILIGISGLLLWPSPFRQERTTLDHHRGGARCTRYLKANLPPDGRYSAMARMDSDSKWAFAKLDHCSPPRGTYTQTLLDSGYI